MEVFFFEDMGRWIGILFVEMGLFIDLEVLYYDYIDVEMFVSVI